MELLDVAISFGILLALCCFLSGSLGVHSAAAPLVALGFVMLYFTTAGVSYLLVPAGFALAGLSALLLVYTLLRTGPVKMLKSLLTPGFVLFFTAGVVCIVYLWLRQPVHTDWDEFSFWGTSVKLLKQNNEMYSVADIGWVWPGTERPGLPLLGYFVQFFGEYAAWKTYVAVDLLMLASVAAALGCLSGRQWRLWVPAGLLALCMPFAISVHHRLVYMDKTWLSALADLPTGLLFGGALCVYFVRRGQGLGIWPALFCLAGLSLMKDNLLPVALVAAVVMVADTLLCRRKAYTLRRRVLESACALATPVGAHVLWRLHTGPVIQNNVYTAGESTGVDITEALPAAVRQLLGAEAVEPRFAEVLRRFPSAFFDGRDYPVSMFGSAFATTLVALLLFAVGFWLVGKGRRQPVAVAAALSLAGMVAYQFELVVAWGFMFKTEGLLDYGRYQSSYFGGFLLLGLYFAFAGAAVAVREGTWKPALVKLGALAAAGGVAGSLAAMVPAGLTVLNYTDMQFETELLLEDHATDLLEFMQPGDRVFFVDQNGTGLSWFRYSYHLLPAVLDFSLTGGKEIARGVRDDADTSPAGMQLYLQQNAIPYILVYSIDEAFQRRYGFIFSDRLAGFDGSPMLYQSAGDGLYVPLYGGSL